MRCGGSNRSPEHRADIAFPSALTHYTSLPPSSRADDAVEGLVVRFGGKRLDPLAIVGQRPARGVGAEGRQQAVVVTCAPAEAKAAGVEREAGDQDPVDLL